MVTSTSKILSSAAWGKTKLYLNGIINVLHKKVAMNTKLLQLTFCPVSASLLTKLQQKENTSAQVVLFFEQEEEKKDQK